MYYFKVLRSLLKVNLQITLAYRADAWANILLNLVWLAWELLSLSIIFSNTDALAGWRPGELIALLGVFHMLNTLMAAVIWPNTERFNASVRDGSLDYVLLQPVDSMFVVSFSRIVVWRAWDIVLGAVFIAVGLSLGPGDVSGLSLANLLTFLLLAGSGVLVLYSLWIVLIALTFWFIKFDNNVTILQALLDAGRYPATVYPTWLRMIITFIVPIALATTVPLQGLRGDLSGWQALIYLVIGAASLVIARQVWKAGVRRYSGASS